MADRDEILAKLAHNKPAQVPLPEIVLPAPAKDTDLIAQFSAVVQEIGGQVVPIASGSIRDALGEAHPQRTPVFASELSADASLADLQLFVCHGALGVAENGAIWVSEPALKRRDAPFITQHLAIVLNPDAIVRDMHDAYKHLDIAADGFGVFIAGPSKTADIEQSLVLGAHGPRSLTVLLTPNPAT